MIRENSCRFCGWKFPIGHKEIKENATLLFCENCGTKIFSENDEDYDLTTISGEKINKCDSYDIIREENNPIARIVFDSNFPDIFKDNLKLVISRLLYIHLGPNLSDQIIIKEKKEITKEILDDLYDKISPIMNLRINDIFLTNLHELSVKEFLKWLKLLQTKIIQNINFRKDFTIFLRWMIQEVYTIIIELWNSKKLPRFERIIRDDLKSFQNYLSSNGRSLNTSAGLSINQKGKSRYRNPPHRINLNLYVKPVIEKFLKSVKSRQ